MHEDVLPNCASKRLEFIYPEGVPLNTREVRENRTVRKPSTYKARCSRGLREVPRVHPCRQGALPSRHRDGSTHSYIDNCLEFEPCYARRPRPSRTSARLSSRGGRTATSRSARTLLRSGIYSYSRDANSLATLSQPKQFVNVYHYVKPYNALSPSKEHCYPTEWRDTTHV